METHVLGHRMAEGLCRGYCSLSLSATTPCVTRVKGKRTWSCKATTPSPTAPSHLSLLETKLHINSRHGSW